MVNLDANPSHILAASSPADERTRTLKHGDTFAVFDHYGDVKPGGLGEEGLYHESTRFLSCMLLELEGCRPFFLNSTVRDENDLLAVSLTNPDVLCGGQAPLPLGSLHLTLKKFLWKGVCYQHLHIKNHALGPIKTSLSFRYGADFVDATPLFVLLAGAYYERTGDRAFVESLWPNLEAALRWIDRYGAWDGDGFVKYQRRSHQSANLFRPSSPTCLAG